MLMSSELRLKTAIVPSASLWTCECGTDQGWKLDSDCGRMKTYLCTFAVVLVLARELLALEFVKHLPNSLRRFRQHGFKRHPRSELALPLEAIDPRVEKGGDDEVVVRQIAVGRVTTSFPQLPKIPYL